MVLSFSVHARVSLKTPRLPHSSVHSDSVQFPNTKRSGQTKSLITNWNKKNRDLDRVDDGTPSLQSSPWSRLCRMILGWLLHKFSSEEVGNFRCRPLCPHKGQTGTALNFKVSTFRSKKNNKNVTDLTCAVGMAGSFFLFIAKVVNIFGNFILFLKVPGLYERVVLVAKPAAACPVGPGTHIWESIIIERKKCLSMEFT